MLPERILLADDNSAILSHVAESLGIDYEIIALISDGEAVIAEAERLRPDLIVLDISMGEVNGIDIARRLQGRGYSGKIVFLTVHEDLDFASAAIGAGGSAYVVKSRLGSDLRRAVEAALSDRLFISSPLCCQ
jgi:DNA-binding NarL/FixJ family response regulator